MSHSALKHFPLAAMLFTASIFAAEPPSSAKTAPPRPALLGPQVEVTLQIGESRRGQLLEYSGGQITLKTDSGEILTHDGSQVLMLRFIATDPPAKGAPGIPALSKPPALPSAQETQLTLVEIKRLTDYRTGERKSTLSKEEADDFIKLRSRLEVHVEALKREIRTVETDDEAVSNLSNLSRSYFLIGSMPPDVKIMVGKAAESITKDSVRKSIQPRLNELFSKIEERFRQKPKKMFLPN